MIYGMLSNFHVYPRLRVNCLKNLHWVVLANPGWIKILKVKKWRAYNEAKESGQEEFFAI